MDGRRSSPAQHRLSALSSQLDPQQQQQQPLAAEPAANSALITAAAFVGGAALAFSYDKYGYPRAPASAVPVPGSPEALASDFEEVEAQAAGQDEVGLAVEELDTPALLIDLDALEHNIRTFAATMEGRGCVWRPHCKAVRSPELAHMLIDAGAVGVTCAKLSQAAALADGGITDILVANEIVHPSKVAALIELAAKCESLCVAVDDELALRAISDAAVAAGTSNLDVLVDVNVGMNRCGIQ
jgi:hypothetical protein